MSFPELYILRHGETEWNAEGRMQGALNSPLTPKGEMDAARQGEILRSRDLDGFAFIASPQGRAFQTAGIALARIAFHIRTDDRLREIGVGEWSGLLRRELKVSVPMQDGPDGPLALYEHAPSGEGFAALEQRCRSFLADLEGPSVLVTHGITSRMIRSLILTGGPDALGTLPGGQGNVFHLHDGQQNLLE
ncbi:histidine phosphatase family protein [Cognatiyoonia sp. IB215182]|uniref:histidine phosphatase family protein n=1 Tax=Cognatiyoonia sp. IB215182 TaxID=3097353 RepID=UPI002A168AA0|nr:histidine phosphatase family protein [Cognatiyoonia sp. IB215182]MDX8353321.1 histidine phosphatase family protein [Cognatiyoonia sp. IB215182]